MKTGRNGKQQIIAYIITLRAKTPIEKQSLEWISFHKIYLINL
jgi:hypothetical protein